MKIERSNDGLSASLKGAFATLEIKSSDAKTFLNFEISYPLGKGGKSERISYPTFGKEELEQLRDLLIELYPVRIHPEIIDDVRKMLKKRKKNGRAKRRKKAI